VELVPEQWRSQPQPLGVITSLLTPDQKLPQPETGSNVMTSYYSTTDCPGALLTNSGRRRIRTSKCKCLIFGMSIGLEAG